jgi:signal transduction histidine kinase
VVPVNDLSFIPPSSRTLSNSSDELDNAFTRRYDGTGLGLPLAKMLTELHGGMLEITGAPGLGTTVIVQLPRDRILSNGDVVGEKVHQSA